MRAAVLSQWGQPFDIVTRPVPEPLPGEVLMRVHAAAVGLTVASLRTGRFGGSLPRIMGHEIAGEIVRVGSGVSDVAPGERRVGYFYLVCGSCRWCRLGRETLCERLGGYVGLHRDGGFAEYVALPAANVLRIPDTLSYEAAAVAADAVNTNWHCLRVRARLGPEDTVVLFGAGGGLGIHGVQVAKLLGATVIAVDRTPEKIALARRWGADFGIVSGPPNTLSKAVRDVTDGRGASVFVDYVGSGETVQAGVGCLAVGGRAVIVGAGEGMASVDPVQLILKEQVLMGSRHSTRAEFAATLDLMARGAVKPVIGQTVALEGIEQLFDALRDGTLLGRGMVTF